MTFVEFRDKVVPQMKAKRGGGCDVRYALGRALRQVPRVPGSRVLIQPFEWEDWLHEVDLPKDRNVYDWFKKSGEPKDISSFVSTLQNKGAGSRNLSAALYYRLHYHVEKLDYANDVDRWAFNGKTFEKFNDGSPVFEQRGNADQNELKTLPPTYPSGIRLDETYQRNRKEFREARAALLTTDRKTTVVVQGAGGYGKTALAEEICLDPEVRAAFPGGIYWLQFGLAESSEKGAIRQVYTLKDAISRMLRVQYNPSHTKALELHSDEAALKSLVEGLGCEAILLIADDLWTRNQADWIENLPSNIAILGTTRSRRVSSQFNMLVEVKRLSPEASIRLISCDLVNLKTDETFRLESITKTFDGWPLLLRLANSTIKLRRENGHRLNAILDDFEEFTHFEDITGLDSAEVGENSDELRRKFVGHCIRAGMAALPNEAWHLALLSLGVFPDNTDIPFSIISRYWQRLSENSGQIEKIGKTKADTIREDLHCLSFFRDYNPDSQTVRVHNVFLAFFRQSHSPVELRTLHAQIVACIKARCANDWSTLPDHDYYGWQNLLHHLERAGEAGKANELRSDFSWLKGKLNAVGIVELQRSFLSTELDVSAQKIRQAIDLSASVLRKNPLALAHQVFGRLGHDHSEPTVKVVTKAMAQSEFRPRPLQPHLPPLGPEFVRFTDHEKVVNYVEFSPDGQLVVSASNDGTARIWNPVTGIERLPRFQGHYGGVRRASFSFDGKMLVTTSNDGTALIWDANKGVRISGPLHEGGGPVTSAAFSRDGYKVVTASASGMVKTWKAQTGGELSHFKNGHSDWITCATFSTDGKKVFTASRDGTVRTWDAETAVEIMPPFVGHKEPVNFVAPSPIDDRMVSASNDGTALIWDQHTHELVAPALRGHRDWVKSANFSTDGKLIVTASNDGTARVWDSRNSVEVVPPLKGHGIVVTSAAFSPDSNRIVTGSYDGTARIWSAQPRAGMMNRNEGHSSYVRCVAFSLDCTKIVSASHDGPAMIWDTQTGKRVNLPLKNDAGSISCVSFSPEGKEVIAVVGSGVVRHWDVSSGVQTTQRLVGPGRGIASLFASDEGRKIITVQDRHEIRVWDVSTGESLSPPFYGHENLITDAATSEECGRLITTSYDKTARLWDTRTGIGWVLPLTEHRETTYNCAEFSPDGKRIVLGADDKMARICDARSGEEITAPFRGHESSITVATFSPDGLEIATGSYDNTVRIWDVRSGRTLSRLDFDSDPCVLVWREAKIAIGFSDGRVSVFDTTRR
tara:strand:- start:1418 stop:5206 length:3789 start_codon:yes stop_codon:yes gene_type:complete